MSSPAVLKNLARHISELDVSLQAAPAPPLWFKSGNKLTALFLILSCLWRFLCCTLSYHHHVSITCKLSMSISSVWLQQSKSTDCHVVLCFISTMYCCILYVWLISAIWRFKLCRKNMWLCFVTKWLLVEHVNQEHANTSVVPSQ